MLRLSSGWGSAREVGPGHAVAGIAEGKEMVREVPVGSDIGQSIGGARVRRIPSVLGKGHCLYHATSRCLHRREELCRQDVAFQFEPIAAAFDYESQIATEELVRNHKIGEGNWQALMAEWNKQQMLDFMFTVGSYAMIAGVMRSTGAERQADLLALAEKYGAPSPD